MWQRDAGNWFQACGPATKNALEPVKDDTRDSGQYDSIVRCLPTADALFSAASRVAWQRPVDMSAHNQRLHRASIRTTCTWCAGAPAANEVIEVQPWHDLVAAGQGQTVPSYGVLAATALMWSLINRQVQSYTSLQSADKLLLDFDVIAGLGHAEAVVMKLMEKQRDLDHKLYTDNFYTSVPLEKEQLKRKTLVCGTLRQNRKFLPQAVVEAKLKKGESHGEKISAMLWQSGMTIGMCSLLTLSTFHTEQLMDSPKVNRRGERIRKPDCVLSYNQNTSGINHAPLL